MAADRVVAGVVVPRIDLGGMPCDLLDRPAVERLLQGAIGGAGPQPLLIASANLDKIYRFGHGRPQDGFFTRSQARDHWLVLLDGAPLAAQATRLTGVAWPRLAGADLLPWMLGTAASEGARVGFLGGPASTHAHLKAVAPHRWPGLEIAGTWTAGPGDLDTRPGELAREIRRVRTDVLAVALTPRGEWWLDRYAVEAGVRVGVAFGAAAEVLVDERRRAPVAWQRHGLEWAWRLVHEPRRLARRYLVQGPQAYVLLRRHSEAGGVAQPERGRPLPVWRDGLTGAGRGADEADPPGDSV
jgi:N-acetylglucosaminyldiphosphoundecaprenol N-acetyl-beta-D-mannosaminyltransferase